ncbi:fumarylacetoacetate hydrolase family protein [uncultured Williamsia sp.]|uniref:fumarylacetoacetate hydrolase family protein n=1 Tax=uncultured Williamsia sp. TaxID=259311 RepID=UPI002638237A|nr:fumarylacetoacetate hydrolase family protein [uncultured Williamsia sp.]
MRLRRVVDGDRRVVAVHHEQSDSWVDLDAAAAVFDHSARGPLTQDLLALLAARERGRDLALGLADRAVADRIAVTTPAPALPFDPLSLRCFLGWEEHWVQAAHHIVRRNLPAAWPFIRAYETVSRRTFPALRPGPAFADHPDYYTGNHRTIRPDGAELPWPTYTGLLDYELEFGVIVDRPVCDATSAEAAAAIGGFVVFDDVSARDVQWEEQRRSSFGPVVKTKTFASAMGSVVVTADEILPHLDDLAARVVVDGETWAETSTAGMRWSPGDWVAYAARGEEIGPGELFTSGTLPSGSGLEIDRWIQPGQTLTLSIDRIGDVTNRVGAPAGGPS